MTRKPDTRQHGVLLGLDVGSVSVKAAVLDSSGNVAFSAYRRHLGKPDAALLHLLREIEDGYGIRQAAVTGMGAGHVAPTLNACAVNEVIARVAAAPMLYPSARSIIDIGGQDSKYILLEEGEHLPTTLRPSCAAPFSTGSAPGTGWQASGQAGGRTGAPRLTDFAMSSACASGTGSFLDQQAKRLGLDIAGEFGETALRSRTPARIAGRCSVFAKSDMIHLQQKGAPLEDIVAGLCFALAHSFKAGIMGIRPVRPPVAFVGGVAANAGVVNALRVVLELEESSEGNQEGLATLLVPPLFAVSGAVGAALYLLHGNADTGRYLGAEHFQQACAADVLDIRRLAPLNAPSGGSWTQALQSGPMPEEQIVGDERSITTIRCMPLAHETELLMGIDIGSISTNIVLMDAGHRVVAQYYLMTASRPVEAVRKGFRHILEYYGERVRVKAVGVTGSGRHLIGDLVGADVVVNEITAHARAAAFVRPDVDTVFEIGGQDSKYIRLKNGLVQDFTMNKACAAGTGSFLEEQAEKLDISIKDEFSRLAFRSLSPMDCGEQCTVFIDTEVVRCQQQGVPVEDIVGGLAYSIVANYMHKVVGKRPVGDVILFQGGVAHNKAVAAAFEKFTGKRVIIPEHNDVMGALGCCLLAKEHADSFSAAAAATFKGFHILEQGVRQKSFQCRQCPNHCDISVIRVRGSKPLFYGGRCERFEVRQGGEERDLPDLFALRERLLLECCGLRDAESGRGVIGYPRMLTFHEYAPFFCSFFSELGFSILLSPQTDAGIIRMGQASAPGQMCFPAKVAYGHAGWMKKAVQEGRAEHVLIPSIRETFPTDRAHEYANHCSYIQFISDLADEALQLRKEGVSILDPALHFRLGRDHVLRILAKTARSLGITDSRKVRQACGAAYAAQARFHEARLALGRQVLGNLTSDDRAAVLVGKAHTIHDPGTSMQVGRIFRRLGMQLIPGNFFDFFNSPEVGRAWRNMTLAMGQRTLAAADLIRKDPRLHAVYLTNFSCVNDSVYPHFFDREMGGKPYLLLEMDEHSAEAGVVTRCEAFADALRHHDPSISICPRRPQRKAYIPAEKRTLYLPHAASGMLVWAAALRAHGINAQVMPPPDEASLAWGRKCLDGKECLPCTLMTGDMLRLLKEGGADPAASAFFMPGSCGSCRYDLFNTLQQIVFEDNGLGEAVLVDEYREENRELHAVMGGRSCGLLSWRGFIAADILEKLRLRTRPYERIPGSTDALYFASMHALAEIVEQQGDIEKAVVDMVAVFRDNPVDRGRPRPVIGLVGEAYLRNVDYASRNLIGKIESMGGEVRMPAIMEVLWYSLYKQWYFKHLQQKTFTALLYRFQHRLLTRIEKKMRRYSATMLEHPYEKPLWEVIRRSGLSLDAGLGFGAALEMAAGGVNGIVHAIPFNCVPGTVIYGLEGRFRNRHPSVPFMTIICSGSEDAGVDIRLEALILQCLHSSKKNIAVHTPA